MAQQFDPTEAHGNVPSLFQLGCQVNGGPSPTGFIELDKLFTREQQAHICKLVHDSAGDLPKLAAALDDYCRPLGPVFAVHGTTTDEVISVLLITCVMLYAMMLRAAAQSPTAGTVGTPTPARFNLT